MKPIDHAPVGDLIADQEDSDVAFTISSENNELRVGGFCGSDGEEFEFTQVKWDGEALSFIA
jgi:hypothetical protein